MKKQQVVKHMTEYCSQFCALADEGVLNELDSQTRQATEEYNELGLILGDRKKEIQVRGRYSIFPKCYLDVICFENQEVQLLI